MEKHSGYGIEKLSFFADKNANKKKAKKISETLKINVITDIKKINNNNIILKLDSEKLSLMSQNMVLYGDFTKMTTRLKKMNLQNELLIKAAKTKNKKDNFIIVDATAGLGEDSFLLAAYGYTVHLYESNPIIAMLLQDALERANLNSEIYDIVNRMNLHTTDSVQAMQNLEFSPDIIFLDPMFPERNKSSLVKKKLQLIQQLEQPCNNEVEMLQAAITAHPSKIIIKRPLKGEWLANVKPSYTLKGKSIRYDCIVIH